MLSGSRSLLVVVGAVASPLAAVAVARRSRRRGLRRRAGTPDIGFVVPPCSRRRDAQPPLLRCSGSLSRHAWFVVLGGSRSLCVVVGAVASALAAVAVARHSRRCGLRRRAGASVTGFVIPPHSRRRDTRPPLSCGGHFSLSVRCVVLSSSRSLLVVVGAVASPLAAVAIAQRSRRRGLRRSAGAPGAG